MDKSLRAIVPLDMDVPPKRLDGSNGANVRWLWRNLRIRNNHHPKIEQTMKEIKELLIEQTIKETRELMD